MAAPGSSFGAPSTGHYLGVGLDFEAVGIAAYSNLEEGAYHGGVDAAGGDEGDEGDDDGRGNGNGNGSRNSRNDDAADDNSNANGSRGGGRSTALLSKGRGRGAAGGFGGYQDARHVTAMAAQQQRQHQHQQLQFHHNHHHQQQQQQQQHRLPAVSGPRQTYPHDIHQQQRQASAGLFGILEPTSIAAGMPDDHGSALRHRDQDHSYHGKSVVQDAAETPDSAAVPYKLSQAKLVVDPPDLQAWRQKLFDVDNVIILTHEQFETYFPHVDNVYSHRSTQRYKRKPFVSHYWDCRMKGRPPGTPKSDDPSKKKRKRSARERDLCDVKIKITEYFPEAGAEAALDRDVAAAIAAGTAAASVVSAGRRFWTIQRVNGNGGNGKGDGVAGPHRHTLQRSDEIKKSSVQRFVATRAKEGRKTQRAPQRNAVGVAQETAREHSKEADLKLYAACFCPFSQRVWIALEAKGRPYQYIETDPFKRPVPTPLLEANPRGRVPAIRQGDWACSESAVILEYLEDIYPDIPLFPSDQRLRANCRLWIHHINTRLVPTFVSLLQPQAPSTNRPQTAIDVSTTTTTTTTPFAPPAPSAPTSSLALLQSHLTALVLAADEQGPYFLGPSLSLVDIHFAPFALRLSRILHHRYPSFLPADAAPGTHWLRWLDALERDPHIKATTSTAEFYLDTLDLLIQTLIEGSCWAT
ncbi:hypothetical protein J3F83DRAFT_750244 [Trichoderma novae-zelandiae]